MPMASEARVLTTSWANTSWPIWVVPSQWLADGPASSVWLNAFGSPAKNGPAMPSSTKNPTMQVPATRRGERNAARSPDNRLASGAPVSAATVATTLVAVTGTASSAGR